MSTSQPAPDPTTSPIPAPPTTTPSSTPTPTSTPTTTSTPASSAAPPTASSPSSSSSSSSSTISSTTPETETRSLTTSSSSTSATPRTSSQSITFIVQTSNGQVFTRTSVVTVPGSEPTGPVVNSSAKSSGFIHNKGALAAVFSIAGIIGLAVIFFLLTGCIRRRRARKLDREIDEAAAVAASAQAPDFDDIDYTSGYGPYSETSHGTLSQPPLSHEQSHHNLGDIPTSYESYSGAGGPGAGAAGIGARGRSVRGGGQPEPYGAFTNPPEQYEMYERRLSFPSGNPQGGTGVPTYDILQAAGLAGSDPYAVTRGPSMRLLNGRSPSATDGLTRRRGPGGSTLPSTVEDLQTSAPGYPGGQDTPYPPEKARYSGSYQPEKARYSASYTPAGASSAAPASADADVYGGYLEQPSAQLDNPHPPGFAGDRAREDEHEETAEQFEHGIQLHEEPARASFADDEDYGYSSTTRVLRVANE